MSVRSNVILSLRVSSLLTDEGGADGLLRVAVSGSVGVRAAARVPQPLPAHRGAARMVRPLKLFLHKALVAATIALEPQKFS